MAVFKVNDGSNLSKTEVQKLEAAFRRINELKDLESAAREYFRAIDGGITELEVLREHENDFTVDGHNVEVSSDGLWSKGYSITFWLPSSMVC